jgi:hypothetical protein
MSAAEALKAGRAAGIRLGIDGDALTLEASEAPSPAVLDPLARRKASLVAVLRLGDVGWSCGDWLVRSPPGRSPRAAVEHATLCCRSEPNLPTMAGCIRAAGRLGLR